MSDAYSSSQNDSIHKVSPSTVRFNYYYVILYRNIATFTLTIVMPFALLVYYNYQVMSVIRRRRRMRNRPNVTPTSRSAILKAKETQRSYVMFSMTLFFIICHSMRFVLRITECFNVEDYQEGLTNNCDPSPFWFLVVESVSNFLLVLNSSICSTIYCLTCSDFRKMALNEFGRFKKKFEMSGSINSSSSTSSTNV